MTNRSAGQKSAGGSTSLTVTSKVSLMPVGSLQVTVVVPTGKNEPDGATQVTPAHVPPGAG